MFKRQSAESLGRFSLLFHVTGNSDLMVNVVLLFRTIFQRARWYSQRSSFGKGTRCVFTQFFVCPAI